MNLPFMSDGRHASIQKKLLYKNTESHNTTMNNDTRVNSCCAMNLNFEHHLKPITFPHSKRESIQLNSTIFVYMSLTFLLVIGIFNMNSLVCRSCLSFLSFYFTHPCRLYATNEQLLSSPVFVQIEDYFTSTSDEIVPRFYN